MIVLPSAARRNNTSSMGFSLAIWGIVVNYSLTCGVGWFMVVVT